MPWKSVLPGSPVVMCHHSIVTGSAAADGGPRMAAADGAAADGAAAAGAADGRCSHRHCYRR